MSWSLRRVVLTLTPVTLFGTAALFMQAGVGMARPPVQVQQAQVKVPPLPPGKPSQPTTEFSHALELPQDTKATGAIQAAKDYIEAAEWETAFDVLETLLMQKETYFTKVQRKAPDGKETTSWISVKAEADRLLGNLSPEGREQYKLKYGAEAARNLKEAKASGDVEKLSVITRYYLHTDAGGEATNLLATYHLDRGEYIAAALCYEKLLSRDDADKLSVGTLFRAAYAFKTTGDTANEDAVMRKLGSRSRIVVGKSDETKSVEELRDYIAKHTRAKNDAISYDTSMVGSVPSRSAQGKGGPAFLEKIWSQPLWRTTDSRQWIERAEASQQNKLPLIPAMQPITATIMVNEQKLSLVIFRSNWGLHAVDMKTGKLKWETPSAWSMDRMFRDTKKVGAINNWVNAHLSIRPNMIVENSTVGTLTTDGTYVFAVEDFGIPPMGQANFNQGFGNPNVQQNMWGEELNAAINASKLQAFELSTGKLKWEVGGAAKKDEKKDELADSYFLGAPLPMGGKLYALMERQQDLRLACLDPLTGKLLHIQTLATARDKMMTDLWRRIQATHLAYGEGILVCPTNSGALLGVDLLSNSLVWAYPYREGTSENTTDVIDPRFGRRGGIPPGFIQGPDGRFYNHNVNTQWKVSPPVIVDGKVVFTAPDTNSIHCINLRDGRNGKNDNLGGAIWTQPRAADDLYLGGVYNGRAIIVGKGYVRALSLASGEQVWRVETGVPSGYGVASNNVYYVPLKEAGPNKEPEICGIDIESGKSFHTKSRKKEVPGNLLFYEGNVLSQTALEMTAYPQLEVQVAKMDEALRKNPNDPEGLFNRGQLRLDKGDLDGAIQDLRKSLKNNPPKEILPQAREKLYDSFTEYFQRDFTKAEEYLPEYEEMCKIDVRAATTAEEKTRLEAEQRRRRANFLCLVAKGKEAQGKLVDAFNRYQEFASEAEKFAKESGKDELMPPLVDEPNVRAAPQVWTGGRIAAMVAKATPENRKPLEDLITKKWDELKKTDDLNEIRNFVRVFGSLFTVGKEARLELANRLMDDSDPKSLLEAEQQLAMVRVRGEDPKLSGRAVETLARLCTRKGLLEDASYYYRVLRDEYAKVPVRDGRTGSDLFNDMATDKRLLPHLDVPTQSGVTGKHVKGDEVRVNSPYNQQVYDFGHVGEKLPFFQKHRLGIRFDYHQLKITDLATGEEKSKNLTRTNFQNMINNGQPNLPKYNYMTMGHLVVLPIAHMVFGIDPIRGEVLWERNLYGEKTLIPGQPGVGGVPNWNQFIVDPKDNSVLLIYPPPGEWVQRIGGPGTLEGSALCLQTRDGLLAIDPVTNKTLWTRSNISSRSRVFNDDQYIYIVEEGSDGNAASTKVLRAYDGVSINVPDFSTQYQKRVRQVGRNLLLSETDAKGQMTYRLYDVLTGKNLWTATYAANSRVLQSEDPNFGGVVEPDGTVRVIDVRNGKEAMKAKMKPADIEKVTSAHLLYDGHYFYVSCNNPTDPALIPFGGVQTNLMPGTGLRSLPINGMLYAFDAQTGKTKWANPLLNQMIVLDHFADMPVVLATSRHFKLVMVGAGRQQQQTVQLEAIAKSGGKFVFQRENQQWQQFHALHLDPKKSTIELVNYQSKIIFTASNEPFDQEKKP